MHDCSLKAGLYKNTTEINQLQHMHEMDGPQQAIRFLAEQHLLASHSSDACHKDLSGGLEQAMT